MDVILTRNQALTIPLLSTYGTASLLSWDGQEVKVPLAPLLGGSTLVRSMVAESQLHPGLHGPLIFSFTVAADVLVSIGDILGMGECNVKEENVEEVKQVLQLFGVKANLSQSRKNTIVTLKEDIKLEIEFEPISDEENDSCDGNNNKTMDKMLEVEAHLSQSEYDHVDTIEEYDKSGLLHEPISEVDVRQVKNNPLKECFVNIQDRGDRPNHSYRRNKKVVTENTVKKCNICEYTAKFASNVKIHMKSHTGEKTYKCPICNYSSSTNGNLKRHIRSHTGEKPFKCNICAYSCSDSNSLKVHNRIHTGEKPYTCKICNKSFSQSGRLSLHIRSHTGEKPRKCKICDYSCSSPYDLKKHERIHTGEKPFKCKICSKSFSQSSHLKDHNRNHRCEKPYECKICSKPFSKSSQLRTHEKNHTGDKNYCV